MKATPEHLPDVDVACGGWSDTMTLKQVYQQADQEGMYRVVSEPARLGETQALTQNHTHGPTGPKMTIDVWAFTA